MIVKFQALLRTTCKCGFRSRRNIVFCKCVYKDNIQLGWISRLIKNNYLSNNTSRLHTNMQVRTKFIYIHTCTHARAHTHPPTYKRYCRLMYISSPTDTPTCMHIHLTSSVAGHKQSNGAKSQSSSRERHDSR